MDQKAEHRLADSIIRIARAVKVFPCAANIQTLQGLCEEYQHIWMANRTTPADKAAEEAARQERD